MEFKYDIRDLQFILKEWLPTEEVAACERFKDTFSIDDVQMLLTEGFKVAKEILHPINAPGDKIGVKFEDGKVTPVPGFKEAYQFLQQNGWGSSSECIIVETGMPLIMYKAIFEMNTGACPALTSCIKLTSGAANLVLRFGTDQDRKMFLPKMFSGEWQGTMCLTEPNYGSDVGDIITRAILPRTRAFIRSKERRCLLRPEIRVTVKTRSTWSLPVLKGVPRALLALASILSPKYG